MQISQAGINLIASFEGLRLAAYQDIAGVWTIGYGHTPAAPTQVITQQDALNYLASDAAWAESAVNSVTMDVTTTQAQFDAMCSLCFNIGPAAFKSSKVLLRHRQGNYASAAADFALWDKATVDGRLVTVSGLVTRRLTEAMVYRGVPVLAYS